jgi:hypothetical protein
MISVNGEKMSKAIAEHTNSISIFWLKKQNILNSLARSGVITWTLGASKNSISYITCLIEDESYIRLKYTQTDSFTGEKEQMDFKVKLTTTDCNYGGKRYWFVCPLSKNGNYCGRRVGVLYSVDKYFGCRNCAEIAYDAQMKGGKWRTGSVNIPDIERFEKEVKTHYYNGKPTRRYLQLMRMKERYHKDLITITSRFGNFF